jgi:prenyltransferase beta subunit
MLQVARVAPKVLGDATGLVRDFLLKQQNADGGFKDRIGRSDLYYTVFGLNSLIALQAELDSRKAAAFLKSFGLGEKLDFIHLCCLARCWAALNTLDAGCAAPPEFASRTIARIEEHRAQDGGYFIVPGGAFGTAYTSFLALGSYQDLGQSLPEPLRFIQSLKFLETPDGAWSNDRNMKEGATNATAAAVTALRHLGAPINSEVGNWLLARAHSQGGFLATPGAPIPDLLSTATALHTLAGLQVSFEAVKESCLDFIDSLWTNEGSFHGHWSEDVLDTEYTFYGLLALGHLSF